MGKRTTRAGRSSRSTGRVTEKIKPGLPGFVIHSNAPWTGTGYGVQTAQLAKAIKRSGRHVTLSVNYGFEGGIFGWEGIEVLPRGFHPYSADVLGAHTKYAADESGLPTALLTLFDCWVYKGSNIDGIDVVASWVPIDHSPAPSDVIEWCKRPNVLPIAMSKFGAAMLDDAGIESMYAPHGIDTTVFRPDATVDGATGRQLLNVPDDAFLIGVVAANKGVSPLRKGWGENLLAAGAFMADHDDAWLYLHTEKRGAQGGIDLVKLAAACNIPTDRIVWTDQWAYYAGLGPDVLATLMASFDVNLACSRGEGFGVPVIETAACGVPSIVSRFSAQPELCGTHSWTTTAQPYWDATQNSWFVTPLVHDIVANLEAAYDDARNPDRKTAARQFALGYDQRTVFDTYWRPIIDEIDRRMADRAA